MSLRPREAKLAAMYLRRVAIIIATLIVMVYMTFVPPWREYHIQYRDPLPYVVEYSWFPTYSWHDQPPASRGQGWGFEYFQSLLWLQLIVVGGIGAGAAFGVRGVVVYGSMAVGFLIGGYFPRILIPAPRPHAGWDSPLIFVIMAFTGLIGAGIGLAFALVILATLPDRRGESRRRSE
ncbi:MAG: hypothetical protein FJ267_07730 [Planctomycetes bacterium]|nr:hypothetical protein [Planctomycetota bacterium]